jgi:murein DD-endopeptidase MepM/ murein hydrolase activator NlpD
MPMPSQWKHRGLLLVFNFLIAIKRLIWWLSRIVSSASAKILKVLFLYFYRLYLWMRFRARFKGISLKEKIREFIVKLNFLFLLNVVLVLGLSFHHTKFYAQAQIIPTAANQPLLLTLLGPGEEYFVEEVLESTTSGIIGERREGLRLGALRPPILRPEGVGQEIIDLGSVALGGTTITKPNILPGVYEGRRTEIIEYIIQPGDTISQIAQLFGISLSTILWENNLNFYSFIKPGQILRILPTTGVSHTVKKGDTLQKIAKFYKVEIEEIVSFNRLPADTVLVLGERLIIPGGSKGGYVPPSFENIRSRFSQIIVPPSLLVPAGTAYIWPSSARRITQYFGWRHTGVDIGGPKGTPIYAARAGRVIYAKCGWNGGYGCNIRIDHGDGVVTLYAHNALGQHFVKVGDYVEQGQVIAGMGSTGRSTGSHLHFEVRVNRIRVNPLKYIK